MEYFLFTTGKETKQLYSSEIDSLVPQRLLTKEKAEKLPHTSIVFIPPVGDEKYPDLITRQACLISDGIKELFRKYDKTIVFRAVQLIDKDTGKQLLYWIMGLDEVVCLSDRAQFYPNKTIKKLVLNEDKIQNKAIFMLGGILEKYIVVRLDVAESLLRRPFYGVEFQPIMLEEEENV